MCSSDLGISAVVLLAVSLYAFLNEPMTYSAVGDCRNTLTDIRFRLSLTRLGPPSADADLPAWLGQAVIEVARNRGQAIPKYLRGGLCRDPWGRPLHIAPADRLPRSSCLSGTVVPGGYLIWSEGPDGQNAYGKGDDIYVLTSKGGQGISGAGSGLGVGNLPQKTAER